MELADDQIEVASHCWRSVRREPRTHNFLLSPHHKDVYK